MALLKLSFIKTLEELSSVFYENQNNHSLSSSTFTWTTPNTLSFLFADLNPYKEALLLFSDEWIETDLLVPQITTR